jgi:Right handed beta helix region
VITVPSRITLVVLFLVLLGVGSANAAAAPPPRPKLSLAQSFVVFVSPNGDDTNACTLTAPCRTLEAAYLKVSAGGLVIIGDGSYPDQTIALDQSKAGSTLNVTFLPLPGSHPFLSKIALGDPANGVPAPSHIALVGLHLAEAEAFTPAQYITWIGLDAGNFYIRGVQHMLVEGGDWGPCNIDNPVNCDSNSKIDYPDGEQPNADITIDGATFHDYRIAPGSSSHFECMFIAGGTNITIENSKFYNCEFYDIFSQMTGPPAGGGITNLTIQNNIFDTPWDGQLHQNRWSAVSFSPVDRPFANVLIRYNSFASTTGIDYNADDELTPATEFQYSNFRIVGNLLGMANSCYPHGTTFEYNVIVDGWCGPTDVTAPLGYVHDALDPSAWDFRLLGNAAGIDLVPGTDADQQLSRDIYGHPRPQGSGYDAGAVEHS